MKCTRCGKDADYYYLAGPVVLCEECACNGVAALADEGYFPFIDSVVPVKVRPDDATLDAVYTLEEKAELLEKMKYHDTEKTCLDFGDDTDSCLPENDDMA